MIKKLLKKVIPLPLINLIISFKSGLSLFFQYFYDYRIYRRHNGAKLKMNLAQIEGKIIAHYHVLEKGISHPTPKNCFSLPVAENLLKLINLYDSNALKRSRQVDVAVEVLKQYQVFSTNKNCLPKYLFDQIEELQVASDFNPGSISFTRESFFKKSSAAFDEFALSRFSVRDFTENNVDIDILQAAIKVAQKTPSVCNRQTAKVHILTNKKDIEHHLALQTGNRGFGHKINKLLIITSDMHFFEGPKERNQAFTDGGMFAMSLLYALHHKKIGAVTLNWAYSRVQDKALHDLSVVPQNEKVILFIGVGHVPEHFKVAVSDRRNLDEVVNII
ncbi:MAG: nitroreductase family protein [Methyloprofundus sp.]|nr:nitroreductase family protein [Methyloprofundus sp.]